MSKLFFFDLETTGTNPMFHGIHQISAIIEIDGQVVQELDYLVRPHPKARIEQEALSLVGKTELDLLSYPPMIEVFRELKDVLGVWVDRFDKKDKFYPVGFNSRAFDEPFLRAWWSQNGDSFFGSWFWPDGWDVMVLASYALRDRRPDMPSFKLKRVAKEMGIRVDADRLHDSSYDVQITREIFHKMSNLGNV